MRNIRRNRRNISELPDELLLKILSLLPTKEAVATSVLSKGWYCLWKQQDIHYVELCEKCSIHWSHLSFHHNPKHRSSPLKYHEVFDERLGITLSVRDPAPPPEELGFLSLISTLKAGACIECKGRVHADKRVTVFIKYGGVQAKYRKKVHAYIWTKLEEKQEMLIESVITRKTTSSYCLSLTCQTIASSFKLI